MRRQKFSAKHVMIIITLICIILIIFTWNSKRTVSPIEKGIAHIVIPIQEGVSFYGDWISGRFDAFQNVKKLQAKNEELEKELDKLRNENKILKMNEVELERLRNLFELDKKYDSYKTVGAKVIGKDPGNWYNMFIINKGEKDGFKVNMVVLANNGLVGRIIEVGPNYSKVRSIIDDTSSVSSKILRTSDLCTVKGDKTLMNSSNAIRVEHIQADAKIIVGDDVVTSHLGDIFPPDILIGKIVHIEQSPGKMTKEAVIEPVVDFKRLEEVLVITELYNKFD